MKINTVTLRNFRNIQNANVSFSDHINVLVGDNGQGKTNLLESIVYLSYGKSFRVNDDQLMIKNDTDFADVKAEIETSSKNRVRVVISETGKFLSMNDAPVNRLSDFIGLVNVVLFQPDDLQFFTQTPKKRRRDIDYEIGKLSHQYMHSLTKVMRLIQERNSMLKSREVDEAYMSVLNGMIADESVIIVKERFSLVENLNPKIQKYYNKLVETPSEIRFSYASFIKSPEENSKEMVLKKFEENFKRDREFRLTHSGIHRDDFVFLVEDIPVVHRLSQGQRRLLIVAYKLAIIECIYEKTGSYPIFCMDDLLSELDETRRSRVLMLLPDTIQCIITTTDFQFLEGYLKEIKFFSVKDGVIREVNKNE
ncbi:hypothetical protein AOC36_00020 [Erysipelothrix larvae]|uniref:DNA replication and repair protein RecF n=1 Tax=Erysipelothrix larvae TaxID=1514105 RepID=A0A109UGE1_9FIRM|nr:DNA replication/repair protein RecF [Erysipelothrix larvae]AMC92433.1 hypothetical protein AOC36_00020 [Erysipelothrix larvae]